MINLTSGRTVIAALLVTMILTVVGGGASRQQKRLAAAQAQSPELTLPKGAGDVSSSSPNARGDSKIVIETGIVNLKVSVTDSLGRLVNGLGVDQFDVFDDKVKQQISLFSDEDSPISIGIIYDVSESMKDRINRSVRALRSFIETSHNDDDFFLIAFNDRARLIQDFTTSADQIAKHLLSVQPRGATALYDAMYIGAEKVQQGRHKKKALLIISDGQDNDSRYTGKELRNRLKEADVQVYAIGITDPADPRTASGRSTLEEITRMTGGRSFFPNACNEPELVEVCTRIALELRHQYSIGFYPTDIASKTMWHNVQVTVNPPKGLGRLIISYKDGYRSFRK